MWLRFAVVSLAEIQGGGLIKSSVVLDFGSDSQSFIATVHPLYAELKPILGTRISNDLQILDGSSFEGVWGNGRKQPLAYYTREEMLTALENSVPYGYQATNPHDEKLWEVVRSLPDDQVLVKMLFQ